jgi:UDP-N-acetyl-2-amino-2-deoxyglucuronate dehydrogenase
MNAERVDRLCRQHGGRPYRDFEAFLTHLPLDLVIIGSPSGLHATHGIAAGLHTLHVLTEKPIDISTKRANALIEAANQYDVKLGVIFQDRLKADIRRFKQWVDEGALGNPLLVDARVKWHRHADYYRNSKWRGTFALDCGGALMNQGVHTVDLLLWLLGDIARVQARTATMLHAIETEDTAVAALEFAIGAIGTLQATTAAYPGYPRRLEITGSLGTVVLEHDRIVAADFRDGQARLVDHSPGARTKALPPPLSARFADTRPCSKTLSSYRAEPRTRLRRPREAPERSCNRSNLSRSTKFRNSRIGGDELRERRDPLGLLDKRRRDRDSWSRRREAP